MREKEGEKHLVASHMCLNQGTEPTTQACALTGNRIVNLFLPGTTPNQLSHTNLVLIFFFNCEYNQVEIVTPFGLMICFLYNFIQQFLEIFYFDIISNLEESCSNILKISLSHTHTQNLRGSSRCHAPLPRNPLVCTC